MVFNSTPSSTGLSTSRYYARAFAIATVGILGYLLFRILSPFMAAIFWAALLALMLQPLNRRLVKRWKNPSLASGLVTVMTSFIVVGPLSLFIFAFVRQASELLSRFRAEAVDRKLPALQLVLEWSPVQALLQRVGDVTALTKEQILTEAADTIQSGLQTLASLGGVVVLGAFNGIAQFFLTMFLLYFFVRDGRSMIERFVRLVPLSQFRKDELAANLGSVARAVVVGTLITALVQGTLIGIGFGIAHLPSPLVFGAIGAIASLIPIVGTSLVWIPAVISLVAQGETGWSIFLTLWCVILVAGSDNVIRPLVISGSSNASTLLIIIGLLGGVSFLGFAGIFMGPLLLTLCAALLRYADESATGISPPAPIVEASKAS